MYVLDTNAFYYASEISMFTYNLEKLQRLIRENDVFISSTSIFEFYTKYKDDIEIINKGIKYIIDNDIKIVENIINPLPPSFTLDELTEDNVNDICLDILKNKIEVESCIVSIIFQMCLFTGYYFTLDPPNDNDDSFAAYVMQNTFKSISKDMSFEFKVIFEEGYKTDDCENYVRIKFYELLGPLLSLGIIAINSAKENGTEDKIATGEWLPEELFSLEINKIRKKLTRTTSNKLLHEIAIKYKKTHNEVKYNNVVKKLSSMFNAKIKFPALQEYCYDTLIGILEHGMALWKNDLLDAIILCNLQEQHVLVTYDNGVIERMRKRQDQHIKYRQSVELIEELKK